MRYLSVCAGIEAATVAWHPLGWLPIAFSEIQPFPSAVLAHHYPDVPNLGDMTRYQEWNNDTIGSVNVLVGGTPCQSFSTAGLRKGLEDPRGGLMLTYLAIAQRYQPQWIVWENVPGVLSSNQGRDFGAFLHALGQLGYGWAYRVLDAQRFGVAQRRRRVFVVGYRGNAHRAAQVLFESESVRGHSASSKKNEQVVTSNIVGCLRSGGNGGVPSSRGEHLVVDSTAVAFEPGIVTREGNNSRFTQEVTGTLRASMGDNQTAVIIGATVRRLTPTEWERLQGFSDGYTAIPWKKKSASNCPDGPRYKALGNSMAVPVMRWIGTRIDRVCKTGSAVSL